MKSFLLPLFLLVSTIVVHAESIAVKDSIAPDTSIVYKTVDSTELSLHIFNPIGHQVTDQVPVIVFFFGGGWVGGTPKQFYEQSRYFANQGVVAISAEYRVNKVHGTTPFDAVTDGKSTIRWVREHATELGIDPNKIVAAGGSAGGHIAACTGIIEGYENPDEDTAVSSKPNALIMYNPVFDTTEKGYGLDKVGEDQKTDISPNHHIKKGVVPTLVFHGKADKTVPFENAERFHKLMKEAGNDCQLEPYEGKGHGFFNGSFFRGNNADKIIYTDIMEKSYAFLKAQLITSDVKPSNLFSNHMVLQRGMQVPVWGTGTSGQKVSVSFAGQHKTTTVDTYGSWSIQLDTLQASDIARDLIVKGGHEIVISDVLVGEVWICSGQSNMQMNVEAVPEIKALLPNAKNIRSFEVNNTVSLKEENEVMGTWLNQIPKSAVAFGFAYYLEDMGNVPVGIIHSSWGSSSIEAWMPRNMTEEFEYFKTIMRDFDADSLTQNRIKAIMEKGKGRSNKEDIFLRRQPNILYNSMMRPLMPYAVRGLIWYQGERNTRYISGVPEVTEANWFHKVAGMKEYDNILKAWVQEYRKAWRKQDMHFMVVMLPGYGKGTAKKPNIDPQDPTEESWAWMRESQLEVSKLPHTSVINTIDLGDLKDIHPKNKRPIGHRLALEAARETLGQNIVSEGPIMKNVKVGNRKLIVSYESAEGLKTMDGKSPSGFWITDHTMQWKPAKAKIKGKTVVLSSNKIKKPLYVRYAFSGKPNVNLVNGAGLPAYPFRTDTN